MNYKIIKNHFSNSTLIRSSLIVVGVVAVIGLSVIGIISRRASAPTPNSSVVLGQSVVINGSTTSAAQLTQKEIQTEESIDSASNSQIQQSITTVNGSLNNLAGAYDASKL
ncbi:MAG TPA: hypothetical protein VMV24_01825 [Candidatus Dormibacteraeota bacterium]|nr:hypothetical protein [Candidatus Dormibacteraeota bacterium]